MAKPTVAERVWTVVALLVGIGVVWAASSAVCALGVLIVARAVAVLEGEHG